MCIRDSGSGSAGDGWVAIGKGAKANTFMNTSGSRTAVVYDAIAEGQYSSAIGSKTHAIGGASMALSLIHILKGVSPNNLGYLKLAINMENIQFDNLPSAENRQKRSKK